MDKKPKTVKLKFTVDPYAGFARLAPSITAPKGYKFKEMIRKGTEATVTFELKD